MTTATKTCPGFAPEGIAPHTEPADLEHFNSNRGGKDGLSTRCRDCGNRYGKAWAAAKKRGEKFSVKPTVAVADDTPVPDPDPVAEREAMEREAIDEPRVGDPPKATVAVVSPLRPTPKYHDDLALRAHRGKAEGYQAELVGDTYFALPVNGTINTPEGQAALDAVNEARTVERRRRDAERKREQRAAAKAKAEGATA